MKPGSLHSAHLAHSATRFLLGESSWFSKAILVLLALVSGAIYLAITLLGPQYQLGTKHLDRPILLVVGLLAAAFVIYLAALALAVRLPSSRRMAGWIFGSSLLFRLLLLPSPPFMEIDLYRYAWDGVVATQGESPFRYSPQQVTSAASLLKKGMPVDDPALARLAATVQADSGIAEVLAVVHYPELCTVYPPVSQWVFHATAACTPANASADWRIGMIKLAMVLFDLATLALLMLLLNLTGRPLGWAIAYGWCPLVLKEFANSGHLDTITIALTTAGLVAATLAWRRPAKEKSGNTATLRTGWAIASAGLLGLGIAAKLYPVVLAPWLLLALWRRGSWRLALVGGSTLLLVSFFGLRPMYHLSAQNEIIPQQVATLADPNSEDNLPPPPKVATIPPPANSTETSRLKTDGLMVFLQKWEMNDLLFAITIENLRPQAEVSLSERPWFALLPDAVAVAIVDTWAKGCDGLLEQVGLSSDNKLANDPLRASFLLTRVITGLLCVAIALVLAWRATNRQASLADWLEAAMLTLAWFWLLAPTQNPWYWCWVVPLLPFARNRTWLAVSGLVLLYYLKFWLKAHFLDPPLLGTHYNGVYFFHFVVVWFEHAPYLLALFVSWCWGRNARRGDTQRSR